MQSVEDTVSVPLSKMKLFRAVILAAAVVALMVWLFFHPDGTRYNPDYVRGVAITGFVFFGFGSLFALWKCFDSRPGLILDRAGIIDNSNGVSAGRIAWAEIRDIKVYSIRNRRFLVLLVRNPEKYLGRGNFLKQRLVDGNNRLTGSPIAISAAVLRMGFSELEQLVRSYWSRYGGAE
jgi:hypothetical protein